ncbi:MAG: hypothetical protein LBJ11_06920 [Oscillospiraceae bacterium]|jgi:hypothetical protein|nr:hypothetical protein [Oscillospiraceae bacterium]
MTERDRTQLECMEEETAFLLQATNQKSHRDFMDDLILFCSTRFVWGW